MRVTAALFSTTVVFCFFLPANKLSAQASAAVSPLTQLDSTMPESNVGSSPYEASVAQLISMVSATELLAPSLAQLIENSLEGQAPRDISDFQLASAFSLILDEIGARPDVRVRASDIHTYRQFESHFAPHIFRRDRNGQVGTKMTAIEAIYLLDKIITHAGLPALSDGHVYAQGSPRATPSDANKNSYRAALDAYRTGAPAQRRAAFTVKLLASLGLH